jgi:hypothetical protein
MVPFATSSLVTVAFSNPITFSIFQENVAETRLVAPAMQTISLNKARSFHRAIFFIGLPGFPVWFFFPRFAQIARWERPSVRKKRQGGGQQPRIVSVFSCHLLFERNGRIRQKIGSLLPAGFTSGKSAAPPGPPT